MKAKLLILSGLMVLGSTSLVGCNSQTTHTVKFETNGGSTVANQIVKDNDILQNVVEPTKENREFAGWYLDDYFEKEFIITTAITKDITLYAKWIGDFNYSYNDELNGFVAFSNSDDLEGDIIIPSEFEGKKIVGVSDNGFMGSAITSVILEPGVNYIGSNAFYGVETLVAVDLGEVEDIEEGAFEGTSMSFVTIPDTVKTIGDRALAFVKPESVSSIEYVFLSSTVPEFGEDVFSKGDFLAPKDSTDLYDALKNANNEGKIYDLNTESAAYAGYYKKNNSLFFVSGSYNAVYLDDSNFSYESMADANEMIIEINEVPTVCLFDSSTRDIEFLTPNAEGFTIKNDILYNYTGTSNVIKIPDGITKVANECGMSVDSARLIVFPDSVIEIGDYVFSGCTALQAIWFGGGLMKIGAAAFAFSSYLGEVRFGYGYSSWSEDFRGLEVGQYAFYTLNSGIPVPGSTSWGGYTTFYVRSGNASAYMKALNENNKYEDEKGEIQDAYDSSDFKSISSEGIDKVDSKDVYTTGVTYTISSTETVTLSGCLYGIYTKVDEEGKIIKQTYGSYKFLDIEKKTTQFRVIVPGEDDELIIGKFDKDSKGFTARDSFIGTYSDVSGNSIYLDGYGNATLDVKGEIQKLAYTTGEKEIVFEDNTEVSKLTFNDDESADLLLKDNTKITDFTITGEEAGKYYDTINGAYLILDGKASWTNQETKGHADIYFNYQLYSGVEYYCVVSSSTRKIAIIVSTSLTITLDFKLDKKELSGYTDDTYDFYLSLSQVSIDGSEGTYTNSSDSLKLDGYFTAELDISGSKTIYHYYKITDNSYVIYNETGYKFITISGNTYSEQAANDVSGMYYQGGNSNTVTDAWYFTPDGHIVYKYKAVGTYTYESGALKVSLSVSGTPKEQSCYISSDKKFLDVIFDYSGDSHAYLYKSDEPLKNTKSLYDCVIYSDETNYTEGYTSYYLSNETLLVYKYGENAVISFNIGAKDLNVGEKFDVTSLDGTSYECEVIEGDWSNSLVFKKK